MSIIIITENRKNIMGKLCLQLRELYIHIPVLIVSTNKLNAYCVSTTNFVLWVCVRGLKSLFDNSCHWILQLIKSIFIIKTIKVLWTSTAQIWVMAQRVHSEKGPLSLHIVDSFPFISPFSLRTFWTNSNLYNPKLQQ